jgi:hypothetical protein
MYIGIVHYTPYKLLIVNIKFDPFTGNYLLVSTFCQGISFVTSQIVQEGLKS